MKRDARRERDGSRKAKKTWKERNKRREENMTPGERQDRKRKEKGRN